MILYMKKEMKNIEEKSWKVVAEWSEVKQKYVI